MAANRLRVAKDKADLMKALVASDSTTGPFSTYADAMVFAASWGAKRKKRTPLGTISQKEPAPISLEVFISRGYELVIKLLAIAATKNAKIISPNDDKSEEERLHIFEEYANGGLEILREELRGTVDYSERLLLMINSERFKQETTEEDFDLSRFL
ncbi:DNA phosphorothioation-associated protein 4 [Lyngbya aestuarii]|uniref:DNA phosphorothioation-associated protein 4 n=1 Tax=Lyngbya aestuarii TaxID=118322 RepID=UPI00403DE135